MKFIEAEVILGLLFKDLAESKNYVVNQSQFFEFGFKLVEVYGKKVGATHKNARRLMCDISKREIIMFTDKFDEYVTYSFLTRQITINEDTASIFAERMKTTYNFEHICADEILKEAYEVAKNFAF